MRPADTSPEAWRVFLEVHRNMPPEEKLARTFELCEFGRALCEAGVRSQYPEALDREVFLRVAERMLGRELFRKVYGNELPME